VCGLSATNVQKKLLSESALKLDKAVETALAMEAVSATDLVKRKQIDDAYFVNNNAYNSRSGRTLVSKGSEGSKKGCYCCGRAGHAKSECRYKEFACSTCGRIGHLRAVCRSGPEGGKDQRKGASGGTKPAYHIRDNTASGSESDCSVFAVKTPNSKAECITVRINGVPCSMLIDSGAGVSVIREKTWAKIQSAGQSGARLEASRQSLRSFDQREVPVVGTVEVSVVRGNRQLPAGRVFVVRDGADVVGREWFDGLGIQVTHPVLTVTTEFNAAKNVRVRLDLKEGSVPVSCKSRPLPFAIESEVRDKLQELVSTGVIESVEQSEWASPLVVVRHRDGKRLRLCGDYKKLNEKLLCPPVVMPTREDVSVAVAGCTVFSKIDMRQAYHQLKLTDDCKDLTTLITPFGLYRYTRLPFGVSPAPAKFQAFMMSRLAGIEHCVVMLDDVLIGAKDLASLQRRTADVRQRLSDLEVNEDKCEFDRSEVEFIGFRVSGKGVSPNSDKVEALICMPLPSSKKELRSQLGMLNFYSAFMEDYSDKSAELYDLLREDTEFVWEERHTLCLDALRKELRTKRVLAPYEPAKPVILTTDASDRGVGGLLTQAGRPVAFVSKKLTDAETRYSQIEKEGLAIVWAIKRLDRYLRGRSFVLETDHQPLEFIFSPGKAISQIASARLARWAVLLMGYQFVIKGSRTTEIPVADALSRSPSHTRSVQDKEAEKMVSVHLIDVTAWDGSVVDREELSRVTQRDSELQKVVKRISGGSGYCGPYNSVLESLAVEKGLIMIGERFVVPIALRGKVLDALHVGHPGIVASKLKARKCCWWPGINEAIMQKVATCEVCQRSRPCQPENLSAWITAKEPMERFHVDLAGPLHGQYLLIGVDAYSNWIEAVSLGEKCTSTVVVAGLEEWFSRLGLPKVLVSDNGSQFVSVEIEAWLARNGITHLRSPRYHPQSNGPAERAVRRVKELLRKMAPEFTTIRKCKKQLLSVLYAIRTTELTAQGVTPATLMFKREFRTRLSLLSEKPWLGSTKPASGSAKIWVRDKGHWEPGEVTGTRGSRVVGVRFGDEGREVVVHRDHIRPRIESGTIQDESDMQEENEAGPPQEGQEVESDSAGSSAPRRSERGGRQTEFFGDRLC
jgi:hypothetical protein